MSLRPQFEEIVALVRIRDNVEGVKQMLVGKPRDFINMKLRGHGLLYFAVYYNRKKCAKLFISLGVNPEDDYSLIERSIKNDPSGTWRIGEMFRIVISYTKLNLSFVDFKLVIGVSKSQPEYLSQMLKHPSVCKLTPESIGFIVDDYMREAPNNIPMIVENLPISLNEVVMYACEHGRSKYVLKYGRSILAKDLSDNTLEALEEYICRKKNKYADIVNMLVHNGLSPNYKFKTYDNVTLISQIVEDLCERYCWRTFGVSKLEDCLYVLLDFGADVTHVFSLVKVNKKFLPYSVLRRLVDAGAILPSDYLVDFIVIDNRYGNRYDYGWDYDLFKYLRYDLDMRLWSIAVYKKLCSWLSIGSCYSTIEWLVEDLETQIQDDAALTLGKNERSRILNLFKQADKKIYYNLRLSPFQDLTRRFKKVFEEFEQLTNST